MTTDRATKKSISLDNRSGRRRKRPDQYSNAGSERVSGLNHLNHIVQAEEESGPRPYKII